MRRFAPWAAVGTASSARVGIASDKSASSCNGWPLGNPAAQAIRNLRFAQGRVDAQVLRTRRPLSSRPVESGHGQVGPFGSGDGGGVKYGVQRRSEQVGQSVSSKRNRIFVRFDRS